MEPIRLVLGQAGELEPELIALRRKFHSFPELSFRELQTAAWIAEELQALGLEIRTGVGGQGIVADLHGAAAPLRPGQTRRTIAFRADIDALPIFEDTGLPYSSENPGVMHACGHDIHASVLLGAAKLLAQRKSALYGTVRFIFQSAEEILQGARAMIAEGAMERVDEIYGLHNLPQMPAGRIGVKPGVIMGSIDRIEIRVEGRGGHGGYPEACSDPIVAASAIVSGLQAVVSRETSAANGAVVSICTFHAGTANNIIPDAVEMTGTVRNLEAEWRNTMPERIARIAAGIAQAHRCKASTVYIEQVPAVDNNEQCAAYVAEVGDLMIGRENRITPRPVTYGEDFAEYLKHASGCFFWLGSGPQQNPEQAHGLHSPRFNPDEGCLKIGAALFAGLALKRLA